MQTNNIPNRFRSILLLAGLGIATFTANAAELSLVSDAAVLLKLLQDKGLISAEEIEAARQELAQQQAAESARTTEQQPLPQTAAQTQERPTTVEPKPVEPIIRTSKWIERIDLYGDARLRFEVRSGEWATIPAVGRMERDRWRYRVRAGANLQFTDNLRAGIRLETGAGGRSTNVTFGDDSGPWGKGSDGIYLGQLFLNWTPTEWFSATAGRQPIPFRTTSMIWDGDLTPEGLTESFKFKAGKFDLFAHFGQYIYDDANPERPFGAGVGFNDAYLLVNQIGAKFNFSKTTSAQIAPMLHLYSGQGDGYRVPFKGTTTANSSGTDNLKVLAFPSEVRFSIGSLPAKVFGDFSINLDGKDRARAAETPNADDQIYAWQLGVELGSTSKKGGWKISGYYQSSDLYALDPNLVDSDLFDSRLNMKGFVLQGSYAFTDFMTFGITFAQADRKNSVLPTGAFGDIGGSAGTSYLTNYQLIQTDLSFRF